MNNKTDIFLYSEVSTSITCRKKYCKNLNVNKKNIIFPYVVVFLYSCRSLTLSGANLFIIPLSRRSFATAFNNRLLNLSNFPT